MWSRFTHVYKVPSTATVAAGGGGGGCLRSHPPCLRTSVMGWHEHSFCACLTCPGTDKWQGGHLFTCLLCPSDDTLGTPAMSSVASWTCLPVHYHELDMSQSHLFAVSYLGHVGV